jgi:hypothetical protein
LGAIFDASLTRALRRRAELLDRRPEARPAPVELRRAWVAYGDYWAA